MRLHRPRPTKTQSHTHRQFSKVENVGFWSYCGKLSFSGISTKSGSANIKGGQNISVAEVRNLRGVLEREKDEIGVYISFTEPTKPMFREAAEAGFYTSPGASGAAGGEFPRIQFLTIQGPP